MPFIASRTLSPARPAVQPSSGPGEATPFGASLSLGRLYAMRFGYLVIGAGLVATQWPTLISRDPHGPLMDGFVNAMLVGLSILAFLGLRHPVRMIPVLLFETVFKLIWLAAVALPLWRSGPMEPEAVEMTVAVLFVVIIIAVTPWRFALRQYGTAPGARWH